jgi:hypothetical protein
MTWPNGSLNAIDAKVKVEDVMSRKIRCPSVPSNIARETFPWEVIESVVGVPIEVRVTVCSWLGLTPIGGTTKSWVEVASPAEVWTATFPLVVNGGTRTVRAVEVAAVTSALIPLKNTLLSLGEEASKPVPEIVTVEPEAATVGVKPVIVGGVEVSRAKDWVLVAAPFEVETYSALFTVPEDGTVTASWVVVAADTVARVPPEPANLTVFWLGVELKPEP